MVKRGQKNLLLVPIAFVNEHIETLHELGTIHILRKHLYSKELNLTTKNSQKLGFFCQNKGISFSTLHFDEIFMM